MFSAATGNTLQVANSFGGSVSIIVTRLTVLGFMNITVAGGARMPYFYRGWHTNKEWQSGIRSYPAPFAELASKKFVITLPSSAVRKIDNVQTIVDRYDNYLDGYQYLAAYGTYNPRNERIVMDCDISAGWMHSGYPSAAGRMGQGGGVKA
jgi:hypothetical protein